MRGWGALQGPGGASERLQGAQLEAAFGRKAPRAGRKREQAAGAGGAESGGIKSPKAGGQRLQGHARGGSPPARAPQTPPWGLRVGARGQLRAWRGVRGAQKQQK